MKNHRTIPSTFEGEMPEVHFHKSQSSPSLKIGNRYVIKDEDGSDIAGELESASVLENEKNAYGIYLLDDGRRIVAVTPLSENELTAYREYPDTFLV